MSWILRTELIALALVAIVVVIHAGEPPGVAVEVFPYLAADLPVPGDCGPVPENRLRSNCPGGD